MFELPAIPAGVILILGVFSPFAVAIVNHERWTPGAKKVVAIVVPLVLAGLALVIYYAASGDPIPNWPILLLLVVLVSQAAYGLLFKSAATSVESSVGVK